MQTDKKEQEGQERQAKIRFVIHIYFYSNVSSILRQHVWIFRQGEAGKGKAASTPTNQAQIPRAYVVLKPLTREEIEAWVGPSRRQDKKER